MRLIWSPRARKLGTVDKTRIDRKAKAPEPCGYRVSTEEPRGRMKARWDKKPPNAGAATAATRKADAHTNCVRRRQATTSTAFTATLYPISHPATSGRDVWIAEKSLKCGNICEHFFPLRVDAHLCLLSKFYRDWFAGNRLKQQSSRGEVCVSTEVCVRVHGMRLNENSQLNRNPEEKQIDSLI